MRKRTIWIAISMIAILATGLLAGCEKKGPMEKAGENIDEAIDDTKDGLKDLGDGTDSVGEKIEEGLEDLGDKAEDVVDDVEKKLEGDG